ncbi:hypothetical protein SAMN05216410_2226 [Sanguibacter gelidistatuariae]|uniref:Uncharacterized protein n=1 Tax=Sanguibacter gelidistatuariae TaxID=1814289 RepID=A0A1G6NV12_9MICO|nr:hypothetical protein [Sanguibacter gelidistatuariae]SDC70995.1 hypothetical protein SAMN05216410_2226 [Sanguibacter gelidistatuariae]
MSLALLPGVTGRHDVFADRRGELVGLLRQALEKCLTPGSTVTVVAPALVSRTTTTAQPDLGAIGYAAPQDLAGEPVLPHETGLPCELPRTYEPPRSYETALHVTASAAVTLLRLAGWAGGITTHEIGAGRAVLARTLTAPDTAPDSMGGLPMGTVSHLVVFACATPDGALPAGASEVLAEAERQAHALHREVVTALKTSELS